MKKLLIVIIATFCLLLTSCEFMPPSLMKNSGETKNAETAKQEKMQKAGMHPMGEAIELKLSDAKHLTQTVNSVKRVLKPQELNAELLTLGGDKLKIDENGTIAPEMIFENTDKPLSMIMINYTIKNNANASCTFNATSRIYRIASDTYKIMDAENSYNVSQEWIRSIYIDAEGYNGSGRECDLITLLPDEEITVEAGYLIATEMLDSMLGYALNPYGTDIKSGMAEVVLGYAE